MENKQDLADTYSSVNKWKSKVAKSTYKSYIDHLVRWLKWLETNGGRFAGLSPDELIEAQRQTDNGNEYEILDLVQTWALGLEAWRYTSKQSAYASIRSFFMHNRTELPQDKGFNIRSDTEPTRGLLSAENIRDMVLSSNPVYRAVILSMFQGGLDLSGFIHWNLNGLKDLREQLREEPTLVKIRLPGRKRDRNKTPYYTLIGKDAIDAIVAYLPHRPDGTAIFYTKSGTLQRPMPISKNCLRLYWIRHLEKIGLIDRSKNTEGKRRRYGYNLHEMRDVRSSLWEKSPAKVSVSEATMGHRVDPLRYRDRSFNDEKWVRTEYSKAVGFLNIMTDTRPYGLVDGDSIQALQTRVTELERERDGFQEQSDYSLGRLEEAAVPLYPGDPAAERRQLKLDFADAVLSNREADAQALMDKIFEMARRKPDIDSIS
ncbi:hypothetical protein D4R47_04120 [archaeon]|nr:MAG: hypothetical protein D4R47_04120 [archaeon]